MKKSSLRQRAEALLFETGNDPNDYYSMQEVLHELAVHQVELEMQNDELEKARNQALKARESYRLLFELAPCGYIVLDESGIVLDVNRAAVKILNKTRDKIVDRPLMMHVLPRDHTLLFKQLAMAFSSDGVKMSDLQIGRQGTPIRSIRFQCRAIFMPQVGKKCLCAMEDVTSLREREAALESVRLANLKILELETDNKWLQQIDKVKSEFVSSVSHEFRTPLTSILGFAKIIQRDFKRHISGYVPNDEASQTKQERIVANLDIIVSESKRLGLMIDDLLDLGKIESGFMGWNDTVVDVHDSVKGAIDALQGLFVSNPDVTCNLNVPRDLPKLWIDPQRLEQVLINLLSNAFKHTERGTILVTACAGDDGGILVRVADKGTGIERHRLVKIFNTFYHGENAMKMVNLNNSGLGLAISKKIIEHYDGLIWAESVVGEGTVVSIEFPNPQK